MRYIFTAALLLCLSFPAFAHVHAASRTAKFAGKKSYHVTKKATKAAKSAALFLI